MASLPDLDGHGHLLQPCLLGLRKPLDSGRRTLQHRTVTFWEGVPRRLHGIPVQHHRLPRLDVPELGRDAYKSLLPTGLDLCQDPSGCIHGLLADGTPPLLHICDALADELHLVPGQGDLGVAGPAGHLQGPPVQHPLHIFNPDPGLLHSNHGKIQQVSGFLSDVLGPLGLG